MRKDVREFIRRLEAAGLTVEPTPGHYRVLRNGQPLRKANGMPFTLPFSPEPSTLRRASLEPLGHVISPLGEAHRAAVTNAAGPAGCFGGESASLTV
jgi:hypothetical protein